MAALREGIHTVLIPADNLPNLEEIDPTVRAALRFVPVRDANGVLANALAVSKSETELSPLPEMVACGPKSGRALIQ